MKKNRRYFLTGLFVMTGFALFALGCVLFGGSELFVEKLYFETYFASSVQGLDVGGAVKFRGVPVGTVEDISFAGDTYRDDPAVLAAESSREVFHSLNYIRVVCAINLKEYPSLTEARLKQMVERGLRCNLGMQGITGVVYINLDYDREHKSRPGKPLAFLWTPEECYVPSIPTILQTLVDVVEDLGEELHKVNFSETIAAITRLAENVDRAVIGADLPHLSATFTQLGESLTKQAQTLELAINALDVETFGDNIKALSENLAATSVTIRESVPTLTERTDATLISFQEVLEQLKSTITEVNQALAEVQKHTDVGEIGREADETVSALARTAAALEVLVDEIREKPSRLFFDAPVEE